ncbi:MAG: thiolase family protein [Saprospiraceae bacterium]|nr:thiolase family protein [Saprospiraceae bacterium]
MTKEVFIVSAVRTPIGSFGGTLADISATKLGSIAIKGALEKAGIAPEDVQDVIMGNVVSANLGQAPARQAAIYAGLPTGVNCTTVNKVCASGMKATAWGAQNIMLGYSDIVVTGGMESMSQIPFYVPKARFGYKYGNGELIDGLSKDGLLDVYDQIAMGVFADRTAVKYGFSREDQDDFAIRSYKNSAAATEGGRFKNEIVGVEVTSRKGSFTMTEDEEYKSVNFDKVRTLRPAFSKDGTVTAANASTINDGASALVLASADAVKRLNLKPLARIVSFADGEHEPEWFTTAPTVAAPIALKRAGLSINDISYFEVNEAFAVVPMSFAKVLDFDPELMNINGGACSLGHPLGCSGARIITTLNTVLHQQNGRYGMAAICNGGGGASAIIIEKL